MKDKIIKILAEVKSELAEFTGNDFIEAGLIESMEIMDIVVKLEEEFEIELDPRDIVAEYFKSVETLVQLVQKNK